MRDDFDEDYSDESYYLDDDEIELVDCPACGAQVYEDAPRCPVCGDYIVANTNYVWANRPAWWVVLGVAGVLAVIALTTFY